MKTFLICLFSVFFVGAVNAQSDLPQCEGKNTFTWNNCFGTNEVKNVGYYSCERKDGFCHGKGTLLFADGKKYVGEFKDGMRTGKGLLFDSQGLVISDGIWAENIFQGGNKQVQQIAQPNLTTDKDPTIGCMQELGANTDLHILFKKLPLDVTKGQSIEVLSNTTKPNAIEKKAILKYIDSIEFCSNNGMEWRAQNYPLPVNNLGAKFQSELKLSIADLYSGKLTFGEFAKIRAKLMTEFMANIQIEIAKINEVKAAQDQAIANRVQADLERDRQRAEAIQDRNARLAAEREAIAAQNAAIAAQNAAMAEEAKRQAVLQYYLRSMLTFQPLPMPKPPVTTNCSAIGNQFNCVTK